MNDTDRLLTYDEAGELLALSQSSLRRLASKGVIPRVKIGNAVRFRLSDLRKTIDSLTEGSSPSQSDRSAKKRRTKSKKKRQTA